MSEFSVRTALPRRHVLQVSEAEAGRIWAGLRNRIDGRDMNEASPDEIVSVAAGVPGLLPEGLLRSLHEFRSDPPESDVHLVRGLIPRETEFERTPASSTAPFGSPESQAAALLLLGVMGLVGEPFNFRTLYEGRIVQHVVPVSRMEHTQTGESSKGTLDWHVEDGFTADRCDHFGLLCVRGDTSAVTEFAGVRDLRLPDAAGAVLREPRFAMAPDTAHVLQTPRAAVTAVISGPAHAPEICYDAHYLTPSDPGDHEAAEALALLAGALDRVKAGHVLEQGDLLLLDNRRVVHARTSFDARYDGADRWLMRTMVCSSVPAYRRRAGRII
ncbi:TauD/TfdA family dioxygenase [Nocardiopsis mangrovi]|uniref:TauD/TfdA family dioxygenase n=1 Tax=Nocardiopsis mangrovi TaxID=1179818 RepID=A0ABV9DZQ9_9ACTN